MEFREEKRDLFSVPDDYYLAHCISADFAMGKGIAVEFNRRFPGGGVAVLDPHIDPVQEDRPAVPLPPEGIQGFGLGVMNARAAYFAKRDPKLASFLTEGRSFGPHGTGLFIANSIAHYDEDISRESPRGTCRTARAG